MPIIGHGDIAKSLTDLDRPDIIFFASGVSNSKSFTGGDLVREYQLLSECVKCGLHLVYFSSLSIYYSDFIYASHKQRMEEEVKEKFKKYTIIRIGNITWGNNPHTIINHFKAEHKAGRVPELQDTHRHLITRSEFVYWIRNIRVGVNDIMNIPGEFVHVKEIWRRVQNGIY